MFLSVPLEAIICFLKIVRAYVNENLSSNNIYKQSRSHLFYEGDDS